MRECGALLHLSSLPGKYGIGDMGESARDFVDFLVSSGLSVWQMLPICPTGYGDSPYQSYSIYAGNPYFIDLDKLCMEGLLKNAEYTGINWGDDVGRVDYGKLYSNRFEVLRLAVQRYMPDNDCKIFCAKNGFWLDDYAVFMALKERHHGISWAEWEEKYRLKDERAIEDFKEENTADIEFWKVIQYFFFKQWNELRRYANERGVKIIGDLPIYVAFDSVDVWSSPEQFQLDKSKMPIEVAGCPPDAFSKEGQLWGNPLYDWEYMEKDGYSYWIKKLDYICSIYDMVRIDHFRGFDSYYAIKYGGTDAKNGVWKKGPGMKLFEAISAAIGDKDIIAEDLGYLTDSVKTLLRESGFAGMKVLQMGFDSRDIDAGEYLFHNITQNCIAYAGTHDNDTIKGFFAHACDDDIERVKRYHRITSLDDINWQVIQILMSSVSKLTVIQVQDLLGLSSEARMNTPSTLGNNWTWRLTEGSLSLKISNRLYSLCELYCRGV